MYGEYTTDGEYAADDAITGDDETVGISSSVVDLMFGMGLSGSLVR